MGIRVLVFLVIVDTLVSVVIAVKTVKLHHLDTLDILDSVDEADIPVIVDQELVGIAAILDLVE